MDLASRIGQLLVVGFDGRTAPDELLARIRRSEVGGVILFSRNLGTIEEVAALTRELRGAAPRGAPLLVSIDQEGGRVQRLKAPVPEWPPMRRVAGLADEALTEAVGHGVGRDLHAVGFNLDFAPVLDVVSSEANTVIGDRAFGSAPDEVVTHALAFARGLERAGVLSCGKHFPGHGGEVADSHHALPVERRGAEALRAIDLVPFREAARADLPMLMTAHVVYEALDPQTTGTFSRRVSTELLREELGFRGVLVSDDLEMAAAADQYEAGEAAVLALVAGVDQLLLCHRRDRQQAAFEALVRRGQDDPRFAARLEEAAERVARLKARLAPPTELSPEAAGAEVRASGRHAELLARLR